MDHERLKVTINAVSYAPGGGMVSLLGYLTAWRELGTKIDVTVFSSQPPVMEAIHAACPDVDVVPFAISRPPWKHFLLQQTRLGAMVMPRCPDVLFGSSAAGSERRP